MNERIRELVVQADLSKYNDLDDTYVAHINELKKFAELIVHRMLAITDAHTEVFQTDRDRALIEHIKKSVTQHFVVAE